MRSRLPDVNVSALWIYPIKSCRGVAVEQFTLDDRGPHNDRRWMLVDVDGRFLSQREVPRLALVDVAIDGARVTVAAPGRSELSFAAEDFTVPLDCRVWQDSVELLHGSHAADQWFSAFLGLTCRLVHMPPATRRPVDSRYSETPRVVSLADAFPMLLIGAGSLQLLNEKLIARGEGPVPMLRFRPNVVVAGTAPHQEDEWKRIRLGDVACSVVKPCARCVTTTVEIETGIAGLEPLRTLATYRKQGSKVLFGQNVVHASAGVIHVGAAVSVDEVR